MDTRTPAKEKSIDVDLTKPINQIEVMEKVKQSCFGKMWDVTTKECNSCADRDTCGIIMRGTVDKKAEEISKKLGATFLDESMFHRITEESIKSFVINGVTSTTELLEWVKTTANTSDEVAVLETTKRFIKEHEFIYTKDGIVWLR